ncbi:MAG: Gfo/Idh/MocA family oxidoreductase [Lentisphaerae bacterium]|jgi:predicted dehydrogenase|nr:Gfo/Idh/MocA family oxidoreductase [Lentisphaerota bacterium]
MAVKIGIIGAGGMADYHIPGFQAEGAEIVAIADVNEAAAKRVAAKYGVKTTYSKVADLLKSDVDAVSIITPNKFHAPLAIEALQAKKDVFCEKPPALNAAEMAAMAAAAAKAKKMLMFNFNNRARPESQAMMNYIRRGAVGEIQSAQALWIRRTGIPGFGGWFTNKELSGGGPVIDLLHMIDLALYFMGYPEPEWALGQTFDTFIKDKAFKGPWGIPDVAKGVNNVEAAAHGFIRFKDGQVLFLRNSWAEMNKREEVSVTFQGTKAGGMVRRLFGRDGLDDTSIDNCELYVQEYGRSVNREIITDADPTMGRLAAASNFVSTLNGKSKPLNTPDEAIKLMKIIDAVYASAKEGAPVKL